MFFFVIVFVETIENTYCKTSCLDLGETSFLKTGKLPSIEQRGPMRVSYFAEAMPFWRSDWFLAEWHTEFRENLELFLLI